MVTGDRPVSSQEVSPGPSPAMTGKQCSPRPPLEGGLVGWHRQIPKPTCAQSKRSWTFQLGDPIVSLRLELGEGGFMSHESGLASE